LVTMKACNNAYCTSTLTYMYHSVPVHQMKVLQTPRRRLTLLLSAVCNEAAAVARELFLVLLTVCHTMHEHTCSHKVGRRLCSLEVLVGHMVRICGTLSQPIVVS